MDRDAPTTPVGQEVLRPLVQDTVYVLYEPSDGAVPLYDIVFFHGLMLGDYRDAWRNTWESKDFFYGRKMCWPAVFLGADFPQARVLSVAYDSSATQASDAGRSDLETVGADLAGQLATVGVGTRPVVLVGHSLGGLVLKQLCLEVHKSTKSRDRYTASDAAVFISSIKGMVFYATPHGGCKIWSALTPWLWMSLGPMVSYLAPISTMTGRVNEDFDQLRQQYGWITLGFYETHAIKTFMFSRLIVEKASACQGMDITVPINKDHVHICKPASDRAPAYLPLKVFLERRLDVQAQSPDLAYRRSHALVGRREELERVCAALREGKVAVIHGGPGEGKSRVAVEAASRFPSLYAFLDLSEESWSSLDAKEAKAILGRMLLTEVWPSMATTTDDSPWETLFTQVRKNRGQPLMIIHDNTEEILLMGSSLAQKVFCELVGRFGAQSQVKQIITSRAIPDHIRGVTQEVIKLSSLPIAEAVVMLASAREPPIDVDTRKKIATMCECNAQLLFILAGFISKGLCTTEDIIASGIRVLDKGEAPGMDAVQRLITTIRKSFSYLGPNTIDWLARMSLWHSFTAEQAGVASPVLLGRVRLSLVQPGADGRYTMHILVREAAADLLKEAPQDKLDEAQEYFTRMAA